MTDTPATPAPRLRRDTISEAASGLGWRLMLGELHTSVAVDSFAAAVAFAGQLAGVGDDVGERLDVLLRPDAVRLTLRTPATQWTDERDLEIARAISELATSSGLATVPGASSTVVTQNVELAVDALDIPTVRLFWKAVLGYEDDPSDDDGAPNALLDPRGQGPAFWFQQMDAPREQRNRLHVDVDVPHDEAAARLEATLAAGGVLVSDAAAPAFWVVADVEGNEACICTWQGRDDR